MKALIAVASLLLIILISGCLGSSNSSIAPTLAFVYAVGSGTNSIQALSQDSTGNLGVLALSTFPTNPRPVSLALHPSKHFLYVANLTAGTVSGFTLDQTTGILTPIGTATPPTPVCNAGACANPVSVAINPGGQFLITLNQGAPATTAPAVPAIPASISVFSIDSARGLLTAVAGSPFPFASLTPGGPQAMIMAPNVPAGNFYVSNGLGASIVAFSLDTSGTPTQVNTVSGAGGADLIGMTIDPKGQFLYAADFVNDTITSFSIGANGALTQAGTPAPTHSGPFALTVDSKGAFLFSAEQGAAGVSSFTINNGVLTQVAGSPFVLVQSGSPQPAVLTVDTTDTFLYVGNPGTSNISGFTIKPDGTLVGLTNSPFAQAVGPQSIVITSIQATP